MQRQLLQDNKACTQMPKFQTIKKNAAMVTLIKTRAYTYAGITV